MYFCFLNITQIFSQVSWTLDIILWLGRLRQEIKEFKASLCDIGRLFKAKKKIIFKVLLFFPLMKSKASENSRTVCVLDLFILRYMMFSGIVLCSMDSFFFFGLKNSHCMLYNTYPFIWMDACVPPTSWLSWTMLPWIQGCRYVLRLSWKVLFPRFPFQSVCHLYIGSYWFMCVNFVSCLSSVKVIGGDFRVIHCYGLNICAFSPNSYVEIDSKDKM